MNHRATALIAVVAAVVLCLGTWDIASAVIAKPAPLAATHPAVGCATSKGLLRVPNSGGDCPTGTTKIGLARPALAPKAVFLKGTKSGVNNKYASLLAGSSIDAHCDTTDGDEADFSFTTPGTVRIAGTTDAQLDGGATTQFVFGQGGTASIGDGHNTFDSDFDGSWDAHAGGEQEAQLDLHLLVTVSGVEFTIDASLYAADIPFGGCHISAMVESATT